MKQLKETFISKKEVSDLDLLPPFWNEELDESYPLELSKEGYYQDAPSMDIDELITMLKNSQEKGANRVYMESHNDHRGYEFVFVKLENKL